MNTGKAGSDIQGCAKTRMVQGVTKKVWTLASPAKATIKGVSATLPDQDYGRLLNTHLKHALEEWVRQAASDAVDPKRLTVEINCKHRFSKGFLLSVGCDTYRNEGGPYPDLGYETINVWTCGSSVRELSIDDLCGGLPTCRRQLMETIEKHTSGSKLKEFWPQVEEAASFGGDPLADFAVGPREVLLSLREYLPHVADGIGIVSVPIDHLSEPFKGSSVFEKVVAKSAQAGSGMAPDAGPGNPEAEDMRK